MAIVVVLTGSYYGYQQLSDHKCAGSIQLNVAAATEIAPAVSSAAQRWVKDGANVNGTCVAVNVQAMLPATVASAVAREHKVTLTGLPAAPATVTVPDVWVADSSTWLLRLKSEAPGFTPTDLKPLAQSPIIVGMPEPVAQTIGWPDKKLGWKDLLGLLTTNTQIRTGTTDPIRDATGLSGLLALGQAAGAGDKAQAVKVGALRALAQGSSNLKPDLLQKFPQSTDPNDIATSLSAAPLSEADVVSYNAQKPPVPLVALYMEPSPPPLDYPYAVMPEIDITKSRAAEALRAQLQTSSFKDALATAGLRAADGSVGTGFAKPIGAPVASPAVSASANSSGSAAAGLDASTLSQALGSWAAITLPGRVLAVFDVSGSMAEPVPTAGGLTRAKVTQGAATQGLALFDDKWAVGTWLFSTDMDGKKPYKEIVPISPLASRRTDLQNAITKIVPKPDGDTGLYDTVLAAYKNVENTWQRGKINSVLLFTDGVNENPEGINQATLISQLKKLNDPKRPVRLVIIGIGTGVDRNELQAITSATPAGGVFIAEDPAKIGQIFLQAIANRTGAQG
ncbi:VWA domain-containing protein [Actinoplanes sp. NPDC051343]|jgi:Ca-activated chloride channel family protein|uniref:VWA domain-containing protein n=1 Tax=Actinoplanes sp. NPDC051343 TaxID=3363906 RepID=UPI0037A68FE5